MSLATTQKHRVKEGGFTLVEALVSVLILSASLVTITSLLTRALQASMASQEYLVASKLAQEGIEMIRVKRNNNLIAGRAWNTNLGTGEYQFAADTPNVLGNTALPNAPGGHSDATGEGLTTFRVYTSGANAGKYTYDAGAGFVVGNFRRKITISGTGNPHSAAVTVKVYYGGNPPFVLSSIIYNAS